MSHDERERKFEQALARHLRRDAGGARNEGDACLDAATLAAFHEGMLSSEETDAAKEHIGDCSRCQEVLRQLGATDEISLQVEAENDLKMREALPTGVIHADGAAIPRPGLRMTAPASASKAPQDISRGRGFRAVRWAAPAGAIAAGLLVWFAARDNKVQTLSPVDKVQVAQEQPREERLGAPRPMPAAPSSEPFAKTKPLNGRRKDDSRVKQPGEEYDGLRAPANSSSDAVANEMGAVAGEASPRAYTRQLQSQGKDYASRAAAENKPDISSRQAVMTAAPPLPPELAKKSVNKNEVVQKEAGRSVAGSAAQAEVAANYESSGLAEKTGHGRIIVASSGTVRWRLGVAGGVEWSVDSGVTWAAQNSGVKAELLAGSAPSEVVCWIVGRSGTILRTTDGGGHWSKVVSPISGDVAGVRAVDAMTAEIFDVSRSVRLVTRDGGVTWEAAKD